MTDQELQHEPGAPADVGGWLAARRESRGLSIEAVAEALHLDVALVRALETEDFAALGATVFAKGHLRAVAGYLGLDTEEAMQRFHAASGTPAHAVPDLIVNYNRPMTKHNPLVPWLIGALIVVVAVIVAWWLWPSSATVSRSSNQPAPAIRSSSSLSDAASAEAPETGSPDRDIASVDAPANNFAARLQTAENNRAALDSANAASAAEVTRSGDTESGLRLSFSDECWYEVRDANGRQVAYGTARAGTNRLITGARPLAVNLGVADAVTVTVDGRPYTISRTARRGRAARFTIP